MDFLQILLLFLLVLGAFVYLWLRHKQNYWPKRNIANDPASLFYFGRSQHIAFFLQNIYQRFKNSGNLFVGIHLIFQPGAFLIDLDLIKSIFIADFESFPDRGFYHNVRDDPLSGNIVRLTGDPWKRLRNKLTPTFTSGKMRYMFSTVTDVGQRFSEVILEQLQADTVLEMRDLCARYTTDVIGSVAFGLECNSLRNPRAEFRLKGDKAFISFNPIIETLGHNYPKLFRKLHIKAFPRELIDFYTQIVTENIAYREEHKIRRNDFLDLLIELKNTNTEGEPPLTLEEIIGQAFVFFIGGFETSSSTMTFCLYELSQNQEIQNRARLDVLRSLEKHDGQLTYECLKEMHYLDQVFAETLRKYPVAPTLKRVARKPYAVPHTSHILEPGVQAIIPVYAIHHDPEYYPNPSQFDPDRFTAEAIKQRHPMTYLPFGAGPRVCIAERFGKMQTMIGLAMLLRDYRFTATEQTTKKLDFDLLNLRIFSVIGGIHLKVEKV